MNETREMVREWYPDATPEQVERFAAAIYRAMLSTSAATIKKYIAFNHCNMLQAVVY